jgi:hypothetical protein
MAKGGPKQYPNLAIYLEAATKEPPTDMRMALTMALAAMGSISFITSLAVLFAAISSHFRSHVVEAIVPMCFSILCACGSYAILKAFPARAKPTPLEKEALEVNTLLKGHLKERRLHKAGPEAVTVLLEEAARQYARVQTTLSSAFWKSPDLPPQYGAIREKAKISAERTMQEIVVLLRPRLSETTKPQHWKDVVEDLAEQIGMRIPDKGYVFPGDIEPAAQLAEGLRSLANEVEQASIRAVTDLPNTNATSTLRSTLSELRALNEAESELDESLRYRL